MCISPRSEGETGMTPLGILELQSLEEEKQSSAAGRGQPDNEGDHQRMTWPRRKHRAWEAEKHERVEMKAV